MAWFGLETQPVASSPEALTGVRTVLSHLSFTPVQCCCSLQWMHFGGKMVQSVAGYSNICISRQTHRKVCVWQLQTLTHARDSGDVHMTDGELQQKLLFSCTFRPFAFTLGHQAIIGWLTALPSQHILSISRITDGILSHKCFLGICLAYAIWKQ